MAVHLIASEGRIVVAGGLDQITIKDGVKAVVKFSGIEPNLPELFKARGESVLVIVANHQQHTASMDEIQGESDQRVMDLGHEYDPNSSGKGMHDTEINSDENNTIDTKAVAIAHTPLNADLQQAYNDGYQAASEGRSQADCPVMAGELCIEWVKGWKKWHEKNGYTSLDSAAA